MRKLLENKAWKTSFFPLNDAEIQTLSSRRNNQLFIAVTAYIVIIFISIYFWNSNNETFNLDNKSFRVNFSQSETQFFQDAVPYIWIGILIVTTYFFIKFLKQTILPLSLDIKKGTKLLVYFTPERSAQKKGSIYYLDLPFLKSQQLELSKKEYEGIDNKEELCLEITPHALHFLSLQTKNSVIKYF